MRGDSSYIVVELGRISICKKTNRSTTSTSLTTVLWSLRSGLGMKFGASGVGFGHVRGGFNVKCANTSALERMADCGSIIFLTVSTFCGYIWKKEKRRKIYTFIVNYSLLTCRERTKNLRSKNLKAASGVKIHIILLSARISTDWINIAHY